MSEIPRARRILQWALAEDLNLDTTRAAIRRALALMTREKPEFRAARDEVPKLTEAQREHARRLRARGMTMRAIAAVLGTNHGRVSDAINGKRKGI